MRTASLRAPSRFLPGLLIAALALLALPRAAQAWWDSGWTLRKSLTIDTSATGAAIADPVGGTTVLVRLHDGNFRFAAAQDGGDDLRFVAADDQTLLPYHIEKYDAVLNEAFVWVRLPDVPPGAKATFWLYYANNGGKAAKGEDAKASYDADTVLVYHFAGHGAPPSDSSAAGNNAQTAGLPADGSMIGGGLRFDGKAVVSIPATASLAWADGAALTWSAWVKPGTIEPSAVIFSRWDGSRAFLIGFDNGAPYVEVTGAGGTQRSAVAAKVTVNTWHHLAVTAGGGKLTLYLDGDPYASLAAAVPALNTLCFLGGNGPGGTVGVARGRTDFTGELDELEISKVARPPGFIKFAALSQGGGDRAVKLVALGDDEQPTNWFSWLKTGYFGVIISSLTVDGWVVIGILMVMSAISWVVMINKVTYLNGISRGNALFLREWKHVATDLTVLDDASADHAKSLGGRVDAAGQKAMRSSSVYRIYHIGAEEIRLRRNAETGKKALSSRSIQAIRASLDGGLVRETQKLNRLIVLLTIAISGGPFLGLLGTVVGVMITFAAVAAAGEVNVNAIAPGIAAALLATVAGLAVAIPALFGYNYIVTRIKDATSDMHVFIDEFVTKMAEFYSGKNE